jgi:hypothetical protein
VAEKKSTEQFDQYEFVALIIPGTLVLCGAAVMLGQYPLITSFDKVTVGGLGLFVILAYVAGHIVDVGGGWLQGLWWLARGMPTDRIIQGSADTLSPETVRIIVPKLNRLGIAIEKLPDKDMPPSTRQELIRAIYIALERQAKSRRIDAFDRTYGLMRGVSFAFLLLAAIARLSGADHFDAGSGIEISNLSATLFFLVCAVAAFQRMVHFGWQYAKELFSAFVQVDLEPANVKADVGKS